MNNPRVYNGSEEPTLLFVGLKHVTLIQYYKTRQQKWNRKTEFVELKNMCHIEVKSCGALNVKYYVDIGFNCVT
jgi:hypothetical protein